MKVKHYIIIIVCMYLVAWILFKLINKAMLSKKEKQFQKQYKVTSSQQFFLIISLSQPLYFFFALDAM